MTQIQGFAQSRLRPGSYFELLYHDVNSTATHESLKSLIWFKGSLRAEVWYLLKSPKFNYKISIFEEYLFNSLFLESI